MLLAAFFYICVSSDPHICLLSSLLQTKHGGDGVFPKPFIFIPTSGTNTNGWWIRSGPSFTADAVGCIGVYGAYPLMHATPFPHHNPNRPRPN
jgi:hypothetical protein